MQNKYGDGGFIPAVENWNFDFADGALFGKQQRGSRPCRGGCRGTSTPKGNDNGNRAACGANTADMGVGPAIVRCTGQADCPCERCRAQRAACAAPINACNACEQARPAVPANPCNACETANQPCRPPMMEPRPGATCPVNQPSLTQNQYAENEAVGMVYAAWQTLADVYDAHHALAAGTLYPELHKPLNGYCPDGSNHATTCQEAAFVLWELRLYLNTHPNDERALNMFNYLMAQQGETYATAFLPECTNAWHWTDCPWPWELAANKGGCV